MTASRPRTWDRGWFWIAILTAVTAVVAGTVVAVVGYLAADAPDAVVSDYYDALRRGDAPAALALGDIPAGPRSMLTSAVLAEQQRVAPMRDVRVQTAVENGSRATVTVAYRLAFRAGPQQVTDTVALTEREGRWRLTRVAVAVSVRLLQASDRAAILGAPVPDGPTLLFPGALPVTFDTPYLELAPSLAAVGFASASTLDLTTAVSPAGRTAVLAAITAGLDGCLSADADPRCPLPSDRFVPGTLRGQVDGGLAQHLTLTVAVSARGAITITGTVPVTGTWQGLSFENVAEPQQGEIKLPLAASTYVKPSLHLTWQQAS